MDERKLYMFLFCHLDLYTGVVCACVKGNIYVVTPSIKEYILLVCVVST